MDLFFSTQPKGGGGKSHLNPNKIEIFSYVKENKL